MFIKYNIKDQNLIKTSMNIFLNQISKRPSNTFEVQL